MKVKYKKYLGAYPVILERVLLTIYTELVNGVMEVLSSKYLGVFHDSAKGASFKSPIRKAKGALGGLERSVKALDRAEWEKLRAKLSLPNVDYGKALQGKLKEVVESNVELIESLPARLLNRLEDKIVNLPRTGESRASIQKHIKETAQVGRSKAELIARDQVGKLNGELTRLRQEALGGSLYIWRTSQDGRVRESHQAMDGLVCKWDDPTVYAETVEEAMADNWKARSSIGGFEGQPGEDYQCRCSAEMVIEDILAKTEGKGEDEDREPVRLTEKLPVHKVPIGRILESRNLKNLPPDEVARIRALRAARKARKAAGVQPVKPVSPAAPGVREPVKPIAIKTPPISKSLPEPRPVPQTREPINKSK